MAMVRYLGNAPITEAVIDFRVKVSPDFTLDQLMPIREELRTQYPVHNEIRRGAFTIGMGKGQPFARSPEPMQLHGHRLSTEDKKNVAQFRIDGFTFSRLKPYTDWENVFSEAKRLWEVYAAKVSPESVIRIAARYINHMRIPLPMHDFSQYLAVPPTIPATLPQEVCGFLNKTTIYDSHLDIQANITQALDTSIKSDEYAIIILDIDAYKGDCNYLPDESKMWDVFAELRTLKNRIFFDMITEDTARLFE